MDPELEDGSVLIGPSFIDGAVRRAVVDGDMVVSETWEGPSKGWVRGGCSIGELLKAPPASEETLKLLGIPS